MLRLKITLVLALLSTLSVSGISPPTSGVGVAWEVTPADRADYYPVNQLTGLRFDDSAFVTRTISGSGYRLSPAKKVAVVTTEDETDNLMDLVRERRDLSTDMKMMEKIGATKNIREARMSAPETWSRQPLSVQFRRRPAMDQPGPDNYEENSDSDEAANLPPLIRAHYAPKADFVTSGRGRGPVEPRHVEGRESRDMPIARSYEEYDVPIFRNIVREHDFDVQIPRNYYYPDRYRSQDYYYRGANTGGAAPNPYVYDRYRDVDEDFELYGRYRPTPKPKRIIYYATLPEIVRKPVDLRNYQRPYDPLIRAPEAQLEQERNRLKPNNAEPSRRPLRYPYDNYDNYVKRSSYYDRRRLPYAAGEDERARSQDRNRANYKEKMRSDDRKMDGPIALSVDDRRLPWPVQIGTEVAVKDNERIPGRKIFGQIDGYERYEGSRIKKTSGNAERKEDTSEETNNNTNNSNGNIN